MKAIALAALFALLASAAAPAQNAPPAPTPTPAAGASGKVHEEMVVTAERGPEPLDETPASVSVLTRDEIERVPAQDLSEMLEFLPGFHALFRESFGGPPPIVTTRGFFGGGEADYVQLRVDGVPVEDIESGLADWRRIRAADVERVEALRGPASSLYGDTALGGVIQVFTRPAPANGTSLSASASGGSYGTGSADVSAGFGGPSVSGGIGGTYFHTDGYRAHNSEEGGILGLSTSGALGSGKWSLDLGLDRTNRQDPGALLGDQYAADDRQSDPLYRFDETDTDRGRLALSFRQPGGPVPYQATLYGLIRSAGILRTLPVAPGIGNRTFRDLHSGALGGIFEGEKSYRLFDRDGLVRLGAELAHETLHTNYRFVDDDGEKGPIVSGEDGDRNRTAVFFTGDYRLTDRLRLSAGVRWDRIADDFHVEGTTQTHEAWSPRAGLNYRVGDLAVAPVSFYFQFSRSFKAPTVDQLFDPHPFDDFQGGTISISNPNLVPQKAQNFEVGASQELHSVHWDVLAYRMTVDNEIDFDPATFSYQNIGASLHRGVEATVRLAAWDFLSPYVSYAWTRVESRTGEHEGRQLKNVPEHLVRAGLSAALPAGLTAEAIWTWMGRRWLDDDDVFPLGDASVVDLRLSKTFGALRARLDLSNLTNTKYAQYGFALTDFSTGQPAPFFYPGARFAARFGIDWRN
ncbi:MAG TPA: TonB-dependent receptor [Thermoanaerobaculia bacterium]